MNLLLRLLERRYYVGAAVLIAAVWAAARWGSAALNHVDYLLHPPAEVVSPLADAILKETGARESAKLRGLHRAVSAEIAAARAKGFSVGKLQRLADSALALDVPAYRSAAVERLNKLRLAIPQQKEAFRPATADDVNPEIFIAPRSKRAARR